MFEQGQDVAALCGGDEIVGVLVPAAMPFSSMWRCRLSNSSARW